MTKTFTVVGTSVLNGKQKVRFANDLALRIKVLARNGHEAVRLVECDAMTKLDAAKWLKTQDAFGDEATQTVIEAFIAKNG